MPRSKRDKIRLRFDSILSAYGKAEHQLETLGKMFLEHHPEYSAVFATQIEGIEMMRDIIEKLRGTI